MAIAAALIPFCLLLGGGDAFQLPSSPAASLRPTPPSSRFASGMPGGGDDGRLASFADGSSTEGGPSRKISLSEYLKKEQVNRPLARIVEAAASASSQVARELQSLPLVDDAQLHDGGKVNVQGEEQKGMDARANAIFIEQLRPTVAGIVSEEEEDVVRGDVDGECEEAYSIAIDPLDGSSNLDVDAPTGTIFGIVRHKDNGGSPFESPARESMVAAGYTVYSSATELVLAGLGKNVVGFALDPNDDTFRLSRKNIRCPERGPYYSLNEAREPDWPDGLRRWIRDAKRGQTPAGVQYSARYVCSLTADVHRTLLKGGWAGNPRPHLRLWYEAAPLAFVAEAAGGAGSDGVQSLLDLMPDGLHGRVCCFLGSKADIGDLEVYGDVRQTSKRYDA